MMLRCAIKVFEHPFHSVGLFAEVYSLVGLIIIKKDMLLRTLAGACVMGNQ